MPTDEPATVNWSENVTLDKGYYHGLVFDIPGVEMNINGEWIRYNAENKDLILAQNPFSLEWRLNGTLLRKLGYGPGTPVTGRIIAVDDQWNGLSLTKDVTIEVRE